MGKLITPQEGEVSSLFFATCCSIGIPLAVEAIKKLRGIGAPRIGQKTEVDRLPKMPPLFFSYPPYVTGQGVKEKS